MITHFEKLGLRAVACKHWQWMGGTLRLVPAPHSGATGYSIRVPQHGYVGVEGEYPDLTDPATLGCLLALVRRAWNDPTISPACYGSPFDADAVVWDVKGHWPGASVKLDVTAESEAEALVAALEGAP
jgi:hypothetical protein